MATSIDTNPRLKASVRDEPKRMLQPISGYEDEPLLPLEEACQPLGQIIDKELQQNMMIAKMNSTESEDGLTKDESASIHLYTMEWKVSQNSLYAVLNRTLRLADRRSLQPWFRYLKLFLTAFFKLPSTEHRTVWRGVPEDLSSLYPKEKEFVWWGISSCTSSISVLQSAQYAGTSGTRTMFSIETNNGKLIRSHSYFQQEDEILLPPGIYLRVIDKFSSADGLNIIHLREVPPPYKMLADPFDFSQLKQILPPSTPSTTQEKFSAASVISKPVVTQENFSTTSVASEPLVTQEQSSTASVALDPSALEPSEKDEPQLIAPKNNLPDSDKKLDCKGRACAKCGRCRDWCWRSGVLYGKNYKKRTDATCTRRDYRVDRDFNFDYFDVNRFYYHDGDSGRGYLCECWDNRS